MAHGCSPSCQGDVTLKPPTSPLTASVPKVSPPLQASPTGRWPDAVYTPPHSSLSKLKALWGNFRTGTHTGLNRGGSVGGFLGDIQVNPCPKRPQPQTSRHPLFQSHQGPTPIFGQGLPPPSSPRSSCTHLLRGRRGPSSAPCCHFQSPIPHGPVGKGQLCSSAPPPRTTPAARSAPRGFPLLSAS